MIITILSFGSILATSFLYGVSAVLAAICCALIGLNLIPITTHVPTCMGFIADDLQVGQSLSFGIIGQCGAVFACITSLIVTQILKTNKYGAFYLYVGMTLIATISSFFIKVPPPVRI